PALAFGAAPAAGAIAAAAQFDCYSFSGAAGDRIRVHVVGSGSLVQHGEIVRPNGTTLCSGLNATTEDLTCRLDTAGTTRILGDDTSGTLTGGDRIVVQRLNNPVGCVPIAFAAAPTAGTVGT